MRKLALFLVLSVVLAAALHADDREEPIDLIIALDRSLSMVEEIGAVKEYVNSYVIDQILQPGDRFVVVAFYGQNEIAVSGEIDGALGRQKVREAIGGLVADGAFTDIGFALDRLRDEVHAVSTEARKKTLLLITPLKYFC